MESGQILHTTLTITDFNNSTHHAGAYVLMVRNAAGDAMVMEWHVREAGEPGSCDESCDWSCGGSCDESCDWYTVSSRGTEVHSQLRAWGVGCVKVSFV